MWYAWECEICPKECELQNTFSFGIYPWSQDPSEASDNQACKNNENSGTDNCGKPCQLTKSMCPAN